VNAGSEEPVKESVLEICGKEFSGVEKKRIIMDNTAEQG